MPNMFIEPASFNCFYITLENYTLFDRHDWQSNSIICAKQYLNVKYFCSQSQIRYNFN